MAKKDLTYWDEELGGVNVPFGKKKNKKQGGYSDMSEDDDEEYERLPLSKEYLNHMADILEQFLQLVKTYFIYPELSQDEYNEAKKIIKKSISRMRKGSTRDFDYDRTMEAIENGDIPEKYIDGGY